MRKYLSRRVSLRLGLGAVALSLGAVVVGPATAASASDAHTVRLCGWAADAQVVAPGLGISDVVPRGTCQALHPVDPYNGPLWVYGDGNFLGETQYLDDVGLDIAVKTDDSGNLMFWA
jgi:hypothetical protein